MGTNDLTGEVIGAAIEVHKELGESMGHGASGDTAGRWQLAAGRGRMTDDRGRGTEDRKKSEVSRLR